MADSNDCHDEAFNRIVHEYYQAVENGQRVDAKVFVDQYPEFKDELESFFADLENLGDFTDKQAMSGTLAATPTNLQPRVVTVGPGTSLEYIGEYQILEEIARGGMGVVFKARQEKLRRTVALKMILSGRLAGAAEVERFQREARAAAAIKHPNIVGVHEIGVHEGQHYFTMDYVESESLRDRLREDSLAPQKAAELIETLARATHFAHTQGILHRDLKPANVLIDSNEQPHITDFGLAKPLADFDDASQTDITRSGQIIGTPSYMSPEQAAAKYQLVGVASDVYSLGAILYACLSGRAPFVAESTVETIHQVIHDEPTSLRVFNQRVPKDLDTVCLKCLAKESHRRYGTANELAEDLQRYLQGRPVLARPISPPVKMMRWAKRNPWISATAVLFMLLALCSPIVAFRELGLRAAAESNLEFAQQETRRANQNADAERNARRRADNSTARSKYFLAMAHWDAGRTRKALRTLEDVPKKQRKMEWNLAYREYHGSDITFYGHTGEVFCVDVSPDDKWIASASDGELRIWNVSAGELHRLIATDGRVTDLKFLDDCRRLVVSITNQICVWDALDGHKLRTLEETGASNQVQCFAISGDEKELVTGTGRRGEAGSISFWNFESGERTKRLEVEKDSGIFRIDLSPDKQFIATVSHNNRFSIRSYESGELAWGGQGTSSGYVDAKFHPTGYSIALLSLSGDINVMKAAHGAITDIYPGTDSGRGSRTIEWSPKGTSIAIGTVNGGIEQVSPATRLMSKKLGHVNAVYDIARCNDGVSLVSAGADRTVRLWSGVDRPTLIAESNFSPQGIPYLRECVNVDWSPDGNVFASAGVSNRISVWNAQTLEQEQWFADHPDLINDVAFFPGGDRIATACVDKRLRVWNLGRNQPLFELKGHRGFISDMEVSPNGRWIASGDQTDEIRLWDAENGEFVRSWPAAAREKDWIRFSPNAERIAHITDRGCVEVRTIPAGEIIRKFKPAVHPSCISFAESSSIIWVGGGARHSHGIEAWNIETGDQVFRKSLGSNELITSLSFAPKFNRLLTADFTGTVKLWDTDTWEELREMEGDGRRRIVRFSPADASFVCGSYAYPGYGDFADPFGTVQVWDASDRFEVVQVYSGFEDQLASAGFSEDGEMVVGSSESGAKIAWDRHSGDPLNALAASHLGSKRQNDGDLIAIPFDDRVRTIDMGFRRQPRPRRLRDLKLQSRIRSMRMRINGRNRGPGVALFEMGWLVEHGDLADAEKQRLLHWIAQGAQAKKAQYAKRYADDPDIDLNLLLSRDVRRAIHRHSLDDPKWLEEPESAEQLEKPIRTSALVHANEIRQIVQEAADHESRKEFDEARQAYQRVLEIMEARTNDPFETLARIGTGKNSFTINHVLDRLARLEGSAGNTQARTKMLKRLVRSIQENMREDVALDWRYLGQIQFELRQYEQSGESLHRYLSMTDKSNLVPEISEFSDFLDAADFLLVYQVMRTHGMRPTAIDGELKNGVPFYRAQYGAIDCEYYTYYGISASRFDDYNKRFAKRGFDLVNQDSFNNAGAAIYCGVWEKR